MLFENQLETVWSNIACKRVDVFLASLVSDWFSELETSDRILAGTLVEFCDVINISEYFWEGGGSFECFKIFLVHFTGALSTATLIRSGLMAIMRDLMS